MAEDDAKIRFINEATLRMRDHTFPYLTQVVGVGGEQEGQPISTGFFCSFQRRRLVATAAHTIDEAESRGHTGIVFTRGEGEMPGVVDGDLFVFGKADLAVYIPIPDSDLHIATGKKYWPVDRIEHDPTAIRRDYLIVTGFPDRFSRVTRLLGPRIFSESLVYGAMMRYREEDVPDEEREQFDRELPDYPFLPADLLAPHEFAIHFEATREMFLGVDPEADDERNKDSWLQVFEQGGSSNLRTFGPGGLSGSPVFRLGGPMRADEWTPDRSRLVGIVTRWLPDHKALVATSSATLLEAFDEAMRSADG